MNREELATKLNELNIPEHIYNLHGSKQGDSIILEDLYGIWKTRYVDYNGAEGEEHHFATEDEACEYVYNWVVKYYLNA